MKKNNILKIMSVAILCALLVTSCNKTEDKPESGKDTQKTENTQKDKNTEKVPDNQSDAKSNGITIPENRFDDIPLVTELNVTDEIPGEYYAIYAVSDGIFKVASNDLSIGLMTADGELIMPCEYSTNRSICDGVTAVRNDMGMWGYFNVEQKKFILECNADSVIDFSEGLGCYSDGSVYRYITPDGTVAFDNSIFYLAAPFKDGLARVLTADKYGYMDKTGNVVINCDYEDFDDFHDGMARVSNGKTFGYIDKTGEEKFMMDTTGIFNYKYGLAAFTVGNKVGYIDKESRVVIPPEYDKPLQNVEEFFRFECGVAPVMKDGKYGFINTDGELVIDAQYDNVTYAVDNVIRVQKDKLFGFITTEGKVITECIYQEAGLFKDGISKVKKDDKYFFINKEGKELTTERFDDATEFCGNTAFVVKEGTDTWYKVTIKK